MARLSRGEVFAPSEIAIVHVMNRVVRRCFLFGDEPISGKNFDNRKVSIEGQLRLAGRLFWNRPVRFCLDDHLFEAVPANCKTYCARKFCYHRQRAAGVRSPATAPTSRTGSSARTLKEFHSPAQGCPRSGLPWVNGHPQSQP